jgi:hypothetical protein
MAILTPVIIIFDNKLWCLIRNCGYNFVVDFNLLPQHLELKGVGLSLNLKHNR